MVGAQVADVPPSAVTIQCVVEAAQLPDADIVSAPDVRIFRTAEGALVRTLDRSARRQMEREGIGDDDRCRHKTRVVPQWDEPPEEMVIHSARASRLTRARKEARP